MSEQTEQDRHYFKTPQDTPLNSLDGWFCATCGKYLTDEIHFREGEHK